MAEQIDTIPVWDAVREAAGQPLCPLCLLERKATLAALRYYLGEAIMAPDVRHDINEKGFSRDHWRLLLQDSRRLPLALAAETRWKTLRERLRPVLQKVRTEADRVAQKTGPVGRLASKGELRKALSSLGEEVRRQSSTCLIEERVTETMTRYLFTFVRLPFEEPDFLEALKRVTLCPQHLVEAALMAIENLDPPKAGKLVGLLLESTDKGWEAATEAIYRFTQSFNQSRGSESNVMKDAPEKVVALMTGWLRNRDKNEEKQR